MVPSALVERASYEPDHAVLRSAALSRSSAGAATGVGTMSRYLRRIAILVGASCCLALGATGAWATGPGGMPARTASSQAPCKAEKKIVKFAEMAVKKAEDANKIKPYKKALKAEEQAKQEYEDCTSSVVIAEPVGTKQPHPFAPPSVGKQLAVDEPISPVAVTEPTTVTGNEPGLYGGSSDYPSCDKEQLKAFLTGAPTLDRKPAGPGGNDIQYTPEQQAENRRKGKAWAEGLGPVSFPKGTLPHVITPDEIAGYIDTLT